MYNYHRHFNFNSGEQLGSAAGTPAFMSPELCAAEAFSGQVCLIPTKLQYFMISTFRTLLSSLSVCWSVTAVTAEFVV